MIICLHKRAIGNFCDLNTFFCRWATASLGNIQWNRNCGSAQLVSKFITLAVGEIVQKNVYFFDESARFSPNVEFFKREVICVHRAKVSKISGNFAVKGLFGNIAAVKRQLRCGYAIVYNPLTAELALIINPLTAEHGSALCLCTAYTLPRLALCLTAATRLIFPFGKPTAKYSNSEIVSPCDTIFTEAGTTSSCFPPANVAKSATAASSKSIYLKYFF